MNMICVQFAQHNLLDNFGGVKKMKYYNIVISVEKQ